MKQSAIYSKSTAGRDCRGETMPDAPNLCSPRAFLVSKTLLDARGPIAERAP